MFDEPGIAWEYEPHTFVLKRDGAGKVTEAFTSDRRDFERLRERHGFPFVAAV